MSCSMFACNPFKRAYFSHILDVALLSDFSKKLNVVPSFEGLMLIKVIYGDKDRHSSQYCLLRTRYLKSTSNTVVS